MVITPDTKNWTWVIERPCPECGFDGPAFDTRATGSRIRALGEEFAGVLAGPDVRRRPDPDTWSPLEYACHVRDVFGVYEGRLARMLTEDDPHYLNWDQDVTAVEGRYGEQDPDVVADELRAAAHRQADLFDAVPEDGWSRPGSRSDGARFTIDTFARYLVHDVIHHLHDVTRP